MALRLKGAGCFGFVLAPVLGLRCLIIARGQDRNLLDARLGLSVHCLTAATTAAATPTSPRSGFAAFRRGGDFAGALELGFFRLAFGAGDFLEIVLFFQRRDLGLR